MQKNLKYFFVHYSQKQFHPLNTCPLGKLQYHPPGTPPTEDAVRVFIVNVKNDAQKRMQALAE